MDPKPFTLRGRLASPQPRRKGPNGRGLCRWCHTEVPKGKRSWCSRECKLHADWNTAKAAVIKRDKDICQECGFDQPKLKRILRKVAWSGSGYFGARPRVLRDLNLPDRPNFVEIDHIHPIWLGGDHHPANLRTLCPDCHKEVSAKQAKERAKVKRLKKKHYQKRWDY